MENQQNLNWLEEESKAFNSAFEGEKLPAIKLIPNKVVEMEIDFSKPFYKWMDKIHKSTKAVIPITYSGQKMVFWLNTANPLYRQLIELGKKGQTKVKVIQTGNAQDTRYSLVD